MIEAADGTSGVPYDQLRRCSESKGTMESASAQDNLYRYIMHSGKNWDLTVPAAS